MARGQKGRCTDTSRLIDPVARSTSEQSYTSLVIRETFELQCRHVDLTLLLLVQLCTVLPRRLIRVSNQHQQRLVQMGVHHRIDLEWKTCNALMFNIMMFQA
ncbi:hypothetical protein HN011_009480 [Eciton burchellii]|nr:hypothetical protein HN011_009480 [Eciton burchellii]